MSVELARAVVEARRIETNLSAAYKWDYDAWLDIHREQWITVVAARETLSKAEEALREAALSEYEASGLKQPFPGVGIRVREKLEYDPLKALAWAHEHHQALSLNATEFVAIVKAMAVMPSFVSLDKVPTATIATDLGAVLEGVGE